MQISEGYGLDRPKYIEWMKSIKDGIGNYFKERCSLLDYGCGSAQFGNYMSMFFTNFNYYGLEPDTDYGNNCLLDAANHIGHDHRIHLGYCDSPLQKKAVKNCDIAILGSIFTHTSIKETHRILANLLPIVKKNRGTIVFTAFLQDETSPKMRTDKSYSQESDCYAFIWVDQQMFQKFATDHGLTFQIVGTFVHKKDRVHSVCRLEA